ncbi:hypothetical protein BREVNS_0481 [Brevinematales bacterium NS]|nr:hypothetical protein BREVNS_0481 [Brevinematales bacterium NS]
MVAEGALIIFQLRGEVSGVFGGGLCVEGIGLSPYFSKSPACHPLFSKKLG